MTGKRLLSAPRIQATIIPCLAEAFRHDDRAELEPFLIDMPGQDTGLAFDTF